MWSYGVLCPSQDSFIYIKIVRSRMVEDTKDNQTFSKQTDNFKV